MFYDVGNSAGKMFDDVTKTTTKKTNEAIKPPDKTQEVGLFDTINNMFYDVGNSAGKMFDDVTKTTTRTLGENVKYQTTKAGLTPAEEAAKLKDANTPEKIAERKAAFEKELSTQRAQAEKAKLDTEKKKQDDQKITEAKTAADVSKKESKLDESKGNSASLNDLRDQLVELNKNMKDLITHTDRVAEHTGQHLRETKKSGSRV